MPPLVWDMGEMGAKRGDSGVGAALLLGEAVTLRVEALVADTGTNIREGQGLCADVQ